MNAIFNPAREMTDRTLINAPEGAINSEGDAMGPVVDGTVNTIFDPAREKTEGTLINAPEGAINSEGGAMGPVNAPDEASTNEGDTMGTKANHGMVNVGNATLDLNGEAADGKVNYHGGPSQGDGREHGYHHLEPSRG